MKPSKSKYSNLTFLFAAWTFICLLGGLEALLTYIFRPETILSHKFFWIPLMRVLNGFAAIYLVLYPGYTYLRDACLAPRVTGLLFLLFPFVFIYLAFSVGQFQMAFGKLSVSSFFGGIWDTTLTDFHHIGAYYFFLLFMLLGRDYYEDRTTALVKQEKLEGELSKTKLLVLKQQIQPHFLFNALNNIVAIIDEKKETAQEMLVDLGELLRRSMEMDFGQMIPLMEEMEILKVYLSIEKKRFEHQLDFEFKIEDGSKKIPFPPFLLQPLAENAIKHGFKNGTKKLVLVIESSVGPDHLHILVRNNGAPIQMAMGGIGLKNVQERIQNSYGQNASYQLKSEDNWVVNEIRVPL